MNDRSTNKPHTADESRASNDGDRLDRLPETAADRAIPGRATREEVIDWWADRFGIPPETFEGVSFWEKGAGKIWVYAGEARDPSTVEALGMLLLRTRQDHWKPTSRAVQQFGSLAERNVIRIDGETARQFAAGENQQLSWDGDWGYLIVTHEIAGEPEPIGVGLYVYGELRSVVPKGSRRDLPPV